MEDRKNDIHISRNIARLRRKMGLTQTELAERLYVSNKTVSKWERGKGLPDINTIEPLAKELNVSVLEIMKATRMDSDIPQEEMNSAPCFYKREIPVGI